MLQREEEQVKMTEEVKEDELDAPSLGIFFSQFKEHAFADMRDEYLLDPLDTTIRLKWTLKAYPNLTTAESVANLMSSFGQTDTDSIVISLKPPKKSADKPPKYGTALVPFKQIGDAFAAVCASGKRERQLEGIEIGWIGGKEPPILVWLKKMGKLSAAKHPLTTKMESRETQVQSLHS
jgi:DnaJ homolog subfamily C member 17